MEFQAMPKMARLSREVVITEKIDGTNASVAIVPSELATDTARAVAKVTVDAGYFWVFAGSRTRWVTPEDDNYGWAAWVKEHAYELLELGPGHHFGEWWGRGINRAYGLEERRFSLFNTDRWGVKRPSCCHVVPTLYRGILNTEHVQMRLNDLRDGGSRAAPGFMEPEGIVVYHTAANMVFKKTVKGDEGGKSYEGHVKKPPRVRLPRDPSKGGRRREQAAITFPGRRSTDSK